MLLKLYQRNVIPLILPLGSMVLAGFWEIGGQLVVSSVLVRLESSSFDQGIESSKARYDTPMFLFRSQYTRLQHFNVSTFPRVTFYTFQSFQFSRIEQVSSQH